MCLNCQLIQASRDGDLSQVKKLIKNGADVHTDDDHPLRCAAEGGHLEVVKYLVEECEANVHARDERALCDAAWGGHLEVVKYLVEECEANVHARDDRPLHSTTYLGQLGVVKYLVEECGADVHAWDDFALRNAAYWGHLGVVKYLKSYIVSQFAKKHIDKQIHIEKLNQVLKGIRALPGIGIDYLYAFENFNHLKTIY